MSISTTGSTDKREKLKKLREFHQKTLNDLGVTDITSMIPKMAYVPSGKTEKYIGFFPSEISSGHDVYVEFCSRDNDPEFEDRALYKWKFNPHFEEEYEKTEPNQSTGHPRYLVPIAELVKVKVYNQNTPTEQVQAELQFDNIIDPDTDQPMDQMTMRDYAAIHMRKPVSLKPWLNELITKNT